MFIQFMHFSSLEVPFSSISKIFIHHENGSTGSGGRGLAGRGQVGAGRVGSDRGEADWPGPRSQTPLPPTSTLFHFLLVCGALVRCASLRSTLRHSHTLSLCRSQPPLRFRVCAARERAHSFSLLPSCLPAVLLSLLLLRPTQAAVLASCS